MRGAASPLYGDVPVSYAANSGSQPGKKAAGWEAASRHVCFQEPY